MGYTHYWRRPKSLDKKKWSKFTKELEVLKSNLPDTCLTAGGNYEKDGIVICGWNDKEHEYEPKTGMVKGDRVAFNGKDDLAHESFFVERTMPDSEVKMIGGTGKVGGKVFQFTKTARKPYDMMVCLALISMKRWFKDDVEVSSDGDKDDWQPALELYRKVTSIPYPTYSMLMEEEKTTA